MTEKMHEPYDLDTVMGYLGDFGKYQAWQVTLHTLAATIAGINMLALVTVAAVPDHRCEIRELDINRTYADLNHSTLALHIPQLTSGKFDSCSLINVTTNTSYKCNSWVFDKTYYSSSLAMEWNFVCDRRWMGAVAQSIFMLGVFTGAVFLGNLADRIGRKPVFCWSAVLQLIFGVSVAFMPGYFSFLFICFLYGIFGSAGSFIPGFVLLIELVGPRKRTLFGISYQGAFAVGMMLVAGWGALVKDRQMLQVVYGCHALVLLGHFWIMDESPRWLWANGRRKEFVHIINKALKMNGSQMILETSDMISETAKRNRSIEKNVAIFELFRTSNIRKRTMNVMFCWFANSLVYYGLSLSTGTLEGNPFLILFIMGLVELPGCVVTIALMDRLGRRCLMASEMIIGGICCIIATNLSQGIVSSSFVFAGKFLISSSFSIIYNYSAELSPTVLRNSMIGLGSMCARTSGALTPLITLLDAVDPKMPAIIFAAISLISGFFVMFLPETLNKPMLQTLEEAKIFGLGDTCFSAMYKKRDNANKVNHDINIDQILISGEVKMDS